MFTQQSNPESLIDALKGIPNLEIWSRTNEGGTEYTIWSGETQIGRFWDGD